MVVNTKVHEALISRVKAGQEAQVRVDAFPDRVLKGRVKHVANVSAKSESWSSTDVKVYPTAVEIEDEFDGLRPDMSAEVTIYTDAPHKNVLIVPIQAIVGSTQMGKVRKCFVLTPNGPEEKEVSIGLNNDTHVEIKSGLKEGDEVVVNPRVLVGDREKTRSGVIDNRSHGDDRPGNGGYASPETRPSPEPGNGPAGPVRPGPESKGSGRPKGAGKKGPPPAQPPDQ
jgi:hypothetical protein